MSVVVAYGPQDKGRSSLDLGAALARSSEEALIVVCVIQQRWADLVARSTDAVWEQWLAHAAQETLDRASGRLTASGVEVRTRVVSARSESAGIIGVVEEEEAELLVLGSSSDGHWGHIAIGSTSNALLHSAPVPVVMAPRGWRCSPQQRLIRVTAALDGTKEGVAVLDRAAAVARRHRAQLRAAMFAVEPGPVFSLGGLDRTRDEIARAWREEATQHLQAALDVVDRDLVSEPQLCVADGDDWGEALEVPGWRDGDLLVVGSSSHQPLLSRVFLGSTASKIVRHSPVPVAVLP